MSYFLDVSTLPENFIETEDVVFLNVRDLESERNLDFVMEGTSVDGKIKKHTFKDGKSVIQCYFKPNKDVSFVPLKKLLSHPSLQFVVENDWKTKTILDNSGNLNLKMRTLKDLTDWNFTNNLEYFPPNCQDETLVKDQKLTVTVSPGYFFNPKEKSYGLYLTLTDFQKN